MRQYVVIDEDGTPRRSNTYNTNQNPTVYDIDDEMPRRMATWTQDVSPDRLETLPTNDAEMKDLFHKAVESKGRLQGSHILDLVNTIIGRKRVSFSLSQIVSDILWSCIPCKKCCISSRTSKRRRIYHKAKNILNRQFDVKNLLRNSNLVKLML